VLLANTKLVRIPLVCIPLKGWGASDVYSYQIENFPLVQLTPWCTWTTYRQ
jgi:hypothetical protein